MTEANKLLKKARWEHFLKFGSVDGEQIPMDAWPQAYHNEIRQYVNDYVMSMMQILNMSSGHLPDKKTKDMLSEFAFNQKMRRDCVLIPPHSIPTWDEWDKVTATLSFDSTDMCVPADLSEEGSKMVEIAMEYGVRIRGAVKILVDDKIVAWQARTGQYPAIEVVDMWRDMALVATIGQDNPFTPVVFIPTWEQWQEDYRMLIANTIKVAVDSQRHGIEMTALKSTLGELKEAPYQGVHPYSMLERVIAERVTKTGVVAPHRVIQEAGSLLDNVVRFLEMGLERDVPYSEIVRCIRDFYTRFYEDIREGVLSQERVLISNDDE